MTRLRFGIIAAIVLLQSILLVVFAVGRAKEATDGQISRISSELEEVRRAPMLETALEDISSSLLSKCTGLKSSSPEIALAVEENKRSYAEGKLEVLLFDGDGKLCFGCEPKRGVAADAFKSLKKYYHEVEQFVRQSEFASDSLILFDDYRWFDLIGRPGRLINLIHPRKRGWGYWNWSSKVTHDQVSGGIIIASEADASDSQLVRRVLGRLRRKGITCGAWNRDNPSTSIVPPGIKIDNIANAVESFLKNPGEVFKIGKDMAVFSLRDDQYIFFGLARPETPVLPLWGLALNLASLVMASIYFFHKRSEIISLAELIGLLVMTTSGFPVLVSMIFWVSFEQSRNDALIREKLSILEKEVVNLDRSLLACLRERKKLYTDWRRKFEEALFTCKSFTLHSVPGSRTPDLKKFPDGSPPADVIKIADKLEIKGVTDSIFVVASSGAFLREISDSSALVRRLGLLPKQQRETWAEVFFDRRGSANWEEITYALNGWNPGDTEEKILGLNFYITEALARMYQEIGKALVSEFNRQKMSDLQHETSSEVSPFLVSDLLDPGGESFLDRFLTKIGEFLVFEVHDASWILFFDLVKDFRGLAQYTTIVFHGHQILFEMLKATILSCRESMQARGMDISVFSGEIVHAFGFPGPYEYKIHEKIRDKIQPPGFIHSGVEQIEGKLTLLAAIVCRNLPGYYLVATMPVEKLSAQTRSLRLKMIFPALGMFLILFMLLWRLKIGLMEPVEELLGGVAAIENRNLGHRIDIHTNDEMEELAGTFNDTIKGMEELEVARIVQQKLLPQEPVAAQSWLFCGRSIMCSEIGGDFYDANPDSEGNLIFIIGDVSGHGVSAALVVAMLKAAFRGLMRMGVESPEELLNRLNVLFVSSLQRIKMVTCIVGRTQKNGDIVFANAGHCYPHSLSSDKILCDIPGRGNFPLGIGTKRRYSSQQISLQTGSCLITYTDGLPEAEDENGVKIGFEAVKKILEFAWNDDPQNLISNCLSALKSATGDNPWKDDVTIAVIKYSPDEDVRFQE